MSTIIPKQKKIWFVNAGTVVPSGTKRRRWAACWKYGFISAGYGSGPLVETSNPIKQSQHAKLFRDAINKLNVDDIVCVYESGTGYLAIGTVIKSAIKISNFIVNGRTLYRLPYIDQGLFQNENDIEKCEYLAKIKWENKEWYQDIDWYKKLTANSLDISDESYMQKALWIRKTAKGFFAPRNTVADLEIKNDTLEVIEEYFNIKFH